MKLAPSILSADFAKLGEEVNKVSESDYLHIDVMDGHFVPNISFGADVMKSVIKIGMKNDTPFDVHLMIEEPDKYLENFMTENTAFITVHAETCPDIMTTLKHIKSLGVKCGISINPETNVEKVFPVLEYVDLVLVMSVHPGFGGQKFIDRTLEKVKTLYKLREKKGYKFLLEIDGGITLDNALEVKEAGVDIIVAGSAVFKSSNPEETVLAFKAI